MTIPIPSPRSVNLAQMATKRGPTDFRDPHRSILAYGDIVRESEVLPSVAPTSDGGAT